MIRLKKLIFFSIAILLFVACHKDDGCQTCYKIVGGVAGNQVLEQRVVCDEDSIIELENTTIGTIWWECD